MSCAVESCMCNQLYTCFACSGDKSCRLYVSSRFDTCIAVGAAGACDLPKMLLDVCVRL